MNLMTHGSILLHFKQGSSDKQFLIFVAVDLDKGINMPLSIMTKFGPTGKMRDGKNYGPYQRNALQNLLLEKLGKGYEIQSVNEKPYTSGDTYTAIQLLENAKNFDQTNTAQPTSAPVKAKIAVTFDAGQFAPIW